VSSQCAFPGPRVRFGYDLRAISQYGIVSQYHRCWCSILVTQVEVSQCISTLADDRRDTWLHPRYSRLVALLDGEMSRLTLRPRPADICLETVQAWMIYSHWMPIDISSTLTGPSYRSRFTESSVWQCLGLAIRWATLLGLDQTAHLAFMDDHKRPSRDEVRKYRTMLYLTESDH
jgi:hypothetical protein